MGRTLTARAIAIYNALDVDAFNLLCYSANRPTGLQVARVEQVLCVLGMTMKAEALRALLRSECVTATKVGPGQGLLNITRLGREVYDIHCARREEELERAAS